MILHHNFSTPPEITQESLKRGAYTAAQQQHLSAMSEFFIFKKKPSAARMRVIVQGHVEFNLISELCVSQDSCSSSTTADSNGRSASFRRGNATIMVHTWQCYVSAQSSWPPAGRFLDANLNLFCAPCHGQ